MSEASTAEILYVPRDLFDEREEKNQAVADRNMAEVRAMFAEIRGEMKSLRADMKNEINTVNITLNAKIDGLDTKIDSVDKKIDMKTEALEDAFSMSFLGLEKRLDDMKDYQNKWFTLFGILFTAAAIIAPVAVALIQKFVK